MLFRSIGKHLGHSFSKHYFTEKFKTLQLHAEYDLCQLESISDFPILLSKKDWKGFNVTIPYKESIIPYLSKIDNQAQRVGAINTIKIVDNELIGYNTDIIGFKDTLIPLLEAHHKGALILGTGGASKAVQYVLQELQIPYTLVSRECKENTLSYEELNEEIIQSHKIIVNTTPLGMHPDVESYPNIPYHFLTQEHLCYDLVYNPLITEFMKRSSKYGALIQNGLPMLIAQAEAAYAIWIK